MSVFTAGNLKRKSVLHDDDLGYTVQGLATSMPLATALLLHVRCRRFLVRGDRVQCVTTILSS
jgi:hypothetical protein